MGLIDLWYINLMSDASSQMTDEGLWTGDKNVPIDNLLLFKK